MRAFPIVAISALAMFTQAGNAAQRTFVSGAGLDSNACTITAPCRGFAAALTHTDADGEIIVLDSAGYGPVTINKSVSIVAPPGVYAGISVFAGDGIAVSGAGIEVALRGLTINGQGGSRGILYTFGARLRVSNCIVSNMTGDGIALAYAGEVTIEDSLIRDNGGNGIEIPMNANLVVARTTIERNSGSGIHFHPGATFTALTVADSHIVRNGDEGIAVLPNAVPVTVSVARSIVANNVSAGLNIQSSGATSPITALVNNNTIVQNLWGVYARSTFAGGVVSGTLSENFVGASGNAGIAAVDTGVLLVLDRNTVTHHSIGIQRTGGAVIETRSSNVVRENGTNTVGTPYTAVGGV